MHRTGPATYELRRRVDGVELAPKQFEERDVSVIIHEMLCVAGVGLDVLIRKDESWKCICIQMDGDPTAFKTTKRPALTLAIFAYAGLESEEIDVLEDVLRVELNRRGWEDAAPPEEDEEPEPNAPRS